MSLKIHIVIIQKNGAVLSDKGHQDGKEHGSAFIPMSQVSHETTCLCDCLHPELRTSRANGTTLVFMPAVREQIKRFIFRYEDLKEPLISLKLES